MRLKELVSGWMTDRPVTISPDRTVAEAQRLMEGEEIRHLLVTEGDRLVGILSDRDIGRAAVIDGLVGQEAVGALLESPVAEVMTAEDIITIDPLTTLAEAARSLVYSKVSALPVIDDGRLVGLLTTHDLLRALSALPRRERPFAGAGCRRGGSRGRRTFA